MVEDRSCSMSAFVNLIAGKWALPILHELAAQGAPVRFRELQRGLSPITQKELTRHLRQFEQQGLVKRTAYADRPLRVEYELTSLGRTLELPLMGLVAWMQEHGAAIAAAPADLQARSSSSR